MLKIFKYLSESKISVLAIIALLVIQAYCDLALPQYTANIVDVGIGQSGIENVAPDKMRAQTYEYLCMFMTEEEIAALSEAYGMDADGNYKLQTKNKEEIEALNESLGVPIVIVSMLENPEELASYMESMQGEGQGAESMPEGAGGGLPDGTDMSGMGAGGSAIDLDTIKSMLEAGMITKEQLLEVRSAMLEGLGDMSGSIISQKAVLFVQNEYTRLGIDVGAVQTRYLLVTGGKMLAYSIVMMITAILVGLLASKVAAKLGLNLRDRVFKKVVSFSNAEMDRFSTASLITRSTNDIQQVQMVVVMLLRMVVYAPILGIGGVIKVAGTRTGMSWIIVVAVGTIMLLVGVLMGIAMPKFKKMQTLVDRLNLVSREILTGIPVIRAFSREKFEEKRFDRANQELMGTQLFTNRVMTFMMPAMMLIMNGISIMIVWFGAKGIDMGNLMVGDMLAFITYTMQIVMSFLMLTMISVMLPRAGVAAGRIQEVIETEPTIEDKENVLDSKLENIQGVLEFENVSFRFPGADEDALENLSFTARPGETTAIIGSTGCGKSTLLNLIPRFYDVTGGRITIDGIDIRDISQHKLRSLLGYVPQRGILFSGDITSNLKFGGEDISDEKIREAVEIAQATEFINSKPEGYHNEISQGGTNVSGGQKQRLSIARAIAKSPKIFLFDDSFSALDYKTDVVLRKALNEKISDATVVIVAQRISTILHADRIIVLDEGRIAGSGRHEELMQTCSTYQEIARSQLSEAELKGGTANE